MESELLYNASKITSRYTTQELFPILCDKEKEEVSKITPSSFNMEMQMTTEERYKILTHPLRKYTPHQECWEASTMFKLNPNVVIFQKFIPCQVYSLPLHVQNITKTLQPLTLCCEESLVFSVTYQGKVMSRLAPGITTSFNVQFSPADLRDHRYQLTFNTEKGYLSVPVIAIGPRPILDFPDKVCFPPSPVKLSTSKVLLVRNVGDVPAVFNLQTVRPFSVTPNKGTLNDGQVAQITISFEAKHVGQFESYLIVRYETGESLYSLLHAASENINIRLEKSFLKVDDTYMGLKRHKTLSMYNRSEHLVSFAWKKFCTPEAEEEEITKLKESFECIKEIEDKNYMKLEPFGIDYEIHSLANERIYEDEVKFLKNQEFLFSHPNLSIIPLTGEIWPNSCVEFTIIFEPDAATNFSADAYCEASGQENRIPLKMQGTGKGPSFQLNFETLDISNIFLCSVHSYEVVVKNAGDIPGKLSYDTHELIFGGKMLCTPSSVELKPGEYATFVFSFSSNMEGPFEEVICFKIEESSEIVRVLFRGTVICPTLHFSRRAVDFGDVAIGFPTVRSVTLLNSSLVPVTFSIRVGADGDQQSITYTDFSEMKTKPSIPKSPKEFMITPAEGVVSAFSALKVKLTFTPNICRKTSTSVMVDMWDSKAKPLSLPLHYNAKFPDILCVPAEISIRFCFINYPYHRTIVLENKSNVAGYFYLIPQQVAIGSAVTYSAALTQGVLQPGGSIHIPLTIMTSCFGWQTVFLNLLVLGAKAPVPCCKVACNGQGPVVSVNPHSLIWKQTNLLESHSQRIILTNDSPIPAFFEATIATPNSAWTIAPPRGKLSVDETTELEVTVYLTDAGRYTDLALIHISNSRAISVNLTAVGTGTSIVIDPPISPVYDLGAIFSTRYFRREVTVTNKGRKHHQLLMSPSANVKNFTRGTVDSEDQTIIKFNPLKLDLEAGESAVLGIEGHCNSVTTVSESFYCYAIINFVGKKKVLFASEIIASFVEPVLEFSVPIVKFCINVPAGDELRPEEEKLDVTNMTAVAVTVNLTIDGPFQLINHTNEHVQKLQLEFDACSCRTIKIYFNPSYTDDPHSRVAKGFIRISYEQHPRQDTLQVIGMVNFPEVRTIPDIIDFGCIPVGSEAYKELTLWNISPLPVTYKWYWLSNSVQVQYGKSNEEFIGACESQNDLVGEPNEEAEVALTLVDDQSEVPNHKVVGASLGNAATSPITLEPSLKQDKHVISQNPSATETSCDAKSSAKTDLDVPSNFTVTYEDTKAKLFPIIGHFFVEEEELDALQHLPVKFRELEPIVKFVEMTPFCGKIKPLSAVTIIVAFRGYECVDISATAFCLIEGGPVASIEVKAKASCLRYHLNTRILDHGTKLFCEPCVESVVLSSTGLVDIDFSIDNGKDDGTVFKPEECNLVPGQVTAFPSSGNILAGEQMEIQLWYFPGKPGYFETEVQLQIGFLEPVSLTVQGFGASPQVHVLLPRPPSHCIPVDIGYTAITEFNSHYCHIPSKCKAQLPLTRTVSCQNQHSSLADLQPEWEIITHEEDIPSVTAIDFAVERTIFCRYIEENPGILNNHSQISKAIPNLTVPAYYIDFGVVIAGSSLSYSALIYNYGPSAVSLSLREVGNKASFLKSKGFTVQFCSGVFLAVGCSTAINVIFNPSTTTYVENRTDLDVEIQIEVQHGGNIPIQIHAVVTYPFVTISPNKLDFECIKCGECKIMAVVLRNDGWTPCDWKASIFPKQKKNKLSKKLLEEAVIPEDHTFTLSKSYGTFQPNEGQLLEIIYKPLASGVHEMVLAISVDGNEEMLSTRLRGEAVEMTLIISDPFIDFGSCLPYPQAEERVFCIENPCNFPVEFFFTDFDNQIIEEERILRALAHYYKVDELFLPVRSVGQLLPVELTDFYNTLMDDVITKLHQQHSRERDGGQPSKLQEEVEDKKSPRRRNPASKVLSTISKFSTNTAISDVGRTVSVYPNDILANKDPEQIEGLLHDYIDELSQAVDFNFEDNDPIKAALQAAACSPNQSLESRSGVLILFFGAPLTDHKQVANNLAKTLDMKLLSIDEVIVEAAATWHTVAAMRVREIINANYLELLRLQGNLPKEPEEIADGSRSPSVFVNVDEVDEMNKKVAELLEASKKKPVNKKGQNEGSSKTAKNMNSTQSGRGITSDINSQNTGKSGGKRNAQAAEPAMSLLTDIPTELIVEIFKRRLNMRDCGFCTVIESLSSDFFTSATSALLMLLKAAGNIKYMQCIILHKSFAKHCQWLTQKKSSETEHAAAEYAAKLEMLTTLSEEQVDELDVCDRALYNKLMLSRRQELFKQRKEKLFKRRLEKHQKDMIRKSKQVQHVQQKKQKKQPTKEDGKKHKTPTRNTSNQDTDTVVTVTEPVDKKPVRSATDKKKMRKVASKTGEIVNCDILGENAAETRGQFDAFVVDFHELLPVLESWDRRKRISPTDNMEKPPPSPTVKKGIRGKGKRTAEPASVQGRLPQSAEGSLLNADDTQTTKAAVGVPVWIIDTTDPDRFDATIFMDILKDNPEINEAKNTTTDWIKLQQSAKLTLLCVPLPNPRARCPIGDVYSLSMLDPVEVDLADKGDGSDENVDITERVQSKTKTRKKIKSRKKPSQDNMPGSPRKDGRSNCSLLEGGRFRSRILLMPGEKSMWKLHFEPKTVGEFSQNYSLEIAGWNQQLMVAATGIATLPSIDMDPNVMFPKVSTKNSGSCALTYIVEKETFDFGHVIISKPKEKSKLHQVSTTFNIKNSSTLPAEVSVSFLDRSSEKIDSFGFEPSFLQVDPGCTELLTVYTSPHNLGVTTETLVFSIKNNPQLGMFKITSQGIKADFELDTKIISFDHMLLYRSDCRLLTLMNKCQTPLVWQFVGLEAFEEEFTISPVEGIIPPLDQQIVKFDCDARKVQVIVKRPLKIEVYDREVKGEPVFSDVIFVSLEVFDVMLDILFPRPKETGINFGKIKVGFESRETFTFKNRGKYDLIYKIVVEKLPNLPVTNIENVIFVSPNSGVIVHGDKTATIQVTCKPEREFEFQDLPVLTCFIVDSQNKNISVAVIPVNISVQSFYSRYKLWPVPNINFGALAVGNRKSQAINIENIGNFDFKYSITRAPKEDDIKNKANDVSMKVSSHRKGVDAVESKASEASHRQGKSKRPETAFSKMFSVVPMTGFVAAGQTEVVNIECCVDSEGLFDEEMIVNISEKDPDDRTLCNIKLYAVGCLPHMDFSDVESIFKEHFVCDNFNNFMCPVEAAPHCIYIKGEGKLLFQRACVGVKATARVWLRNCGLVPCDLSCSFSGNKAIKQNQDQTFNIFPSKFCVLPQESQTVTITFLPMLIDTYSAVLEIMIEMPSAMKPVKQSFKICGDGNIPQVCIISPETKAKDGETLITYDPTLVGHTILRSFVLKNTGIISCKVIIEVYKNPDNLFKLYPSEETTPLLKTADHTVPVIHTTVVGLSPGQTADFNIHFTPLQVGTFEAELKLFIIDNPFENLSIVVSAEGYADDITLEGLLPQTNHQNSISSLISVKDTGSHCYFLNFGTCYLFKSHTECFKATNNSYVDTYRFGWDVLPQFTISPAIGHLGPRTSKDITVTFSPTEAVDISKVGFSCTLCKINYRENILETVTWDDRQTEVKWIRDTSGISQEQLPEPNEIKDEPAETTSSSDSTDQRSSDLQINVPQSNSTVVPRSQPQEGPLQKTVIPVEEPLHEVVEGSTQVLTVNVTAVADYPKCTCSVNQINFQDTLMFQSREFFFTQTNCGSVPLEFKWTISLENQPGRTHSTSLLDAIQSLAEMSDSKRPSSQQSLSSLASLHLPVSRRQRPEPLTGTECLLKTLDAWGPSTEPSKEPQWSQEGLNSQQYSPFRIEPKGGTLLPQENVKCRVVFSPLDVFDYKVKLTCRIPHRDPEQPPPEISVTARSLMPFCHFNVEESDYLSSGRRDPLLPGAAGIPRVPLDPETKVVEFTVLGIGVTRTKKFMAINPTDKTYCFAWRNVSAAGSQTVPSFQCATLDGKVESGKQAEMIFSFTAQDIGIFESFWNFSILDLGIETPFLLVGHVMEPKVYFLCAHINMDPTLLGMKTVKHVILVNSENIALPFSFDQDSLHSEGWLQGLNVDPRSGILEPNSEQVIRFEFTPSIAGETAFSLKCAIRKMKNPLKLSVVGTCYVVQPVLSYQDVNNRKHDLDPHKVTTIDFERLSPHQSKSVGFSLTNIGKASFSFNWQYNEADAKGHKVRLSFSQIEGHVTSQSRCNFTMSLTFLKKTNLKNFEAILVISRGPQYRMLLQGQAALPLFRFGSNDIQFGACLVQNSNSTCYNKIDLMFSNNDEAPLVIESFFENKPHLAISLSTEPVAPQTTLAIPVMFYPVARRVYAETLTFLVNGCYETKIPVSGEGVDMKVMLACAQHKCIQMGAVQCGHSSFKFVPIINQSRTTVKATLLLSEQLTSNEDAQLEQPTPELLSNVLRIDPNTATILAGETIKILIRYSPTTRMKPFAEKVFIQIQDYIEPICVVKGSCVGAEFSLTRSGLLFGAVVAGCTSTLKVLLHNSGDIGARFSWTSEKLGNMFVISPSKGYCSPGTSVTFLVEFQPNKVEQSICRTVNCEIENYGPLTLTLSGTCISQPLPKDTIQFSTTVRKEDRKSIPITNRNNETWMLFPQISGDYFSGTETFSIPPQGVIPYEIVYLPLMMTVDNKHSGSVYFRFPDGQAALYSLIGSAEPPLAAGKISREIPCKTLYTELLTVSNWLQVPQRFRASNTLIKADKFDPVCNITGNNYIDVPENTNREYHLNIFVYRECNIAYKITFTNEETGEYQFYELAIRAVKCGPIEVIKLVSAVRQPVTYELKLENPLNINVNYVCTCPCPEVQLPTQFGVQAMSTRFLPLEFLPLQPGETNWKFEANCTELGLFPYTLNLSVSPAPDEKPILFTTALGSAMTAEATVFNMSRTKADFTCKVDNPDFHVEKLLTVLPSHDGGIEVTFEPSALGNNHGVLTATSTAGDFVFPLVGSGVLPQPQGPLLLKPGATITIPFRNVFRETKTFTFYVDLPAFTLKSNSETLKAKKDTKIAVSLQPLKNLNIVDPRFPVAGKLVVVCTDPALSHVSWIYYLKGVVEQC